MSTFNIKLKHDELLTIGGYTGYICMFLGVFMVLPILVAIICQDAQRYINAFTISAIITFISGSLAYVYCKNDKTVHLSLKGSLIFVMGIWGVVAFFAALPFFISGDLNLIDAFFESMSGITTTGYSMYPPCDFNYSIGLWRSLIQWLGGLGIIFLLLVLVPSSMSMKRLFFAEGRTEQMTPNIKHTNIIFVKVYLIITAFAILLYLIAGLDIYDATCYAFTSIATGGFSVDSSSVGNFQSPFIQLITIILMLIGSTNFIIFYKIYKREVSNLFKDIEVRSMAILVIIATIIVSFNLYMNNYYGHDILTIMRHSLFQVVSTISSTGFQSMDISYWPSLSITILILLMFAGGSICSTSGGIKLYNIAILFKSIWWQTEEMLLPKNTIFKRKINHAAKEKEISNREIKEILIYVLAYVMIFILSTFVISIYYNNFEYACFLSAASIGNIGIGSLVSSSMPIFIKILLILEFWVGRIGIWPLLLSMVYLINMGKNKIKSFEEK